MPPHAYDVVFVDHDHRLSCLAEQIDAVLPLCHDRTVFLFDDAVPPSIGMAGPAPSQPWWVGEVWMLAGLLKGGAGFHLATCDLPPTGLMIAGGFAPLDPVTLKRDYAALRAIDSDEALRQRFDHQTPAVVLQRASSILAEIERARMIAVVAGRREELPEGAGRTLRGLRPWRKAPPQFLLDLSGRGLDARALFQAERQASGRFLDCFQDAWLVGFSGILVGDRYYDHWVDPALAARRLTNMAEGLGSWENRGTGFRLLEDRVVLPRERLEGAPVLSEPVLLGAPDEPDNWGMWLLLGIPGMLQFLAERGRFSRFVVELRHPWQRALCAAMGLTPDELLDRGSSQVMQCREVGMLRGSYRDMVLSPEELAGFDVLGARLAAEAKAGTPDKLFVSRLTRTRQSGGYRGLVDEEALIAALEAQGFTAIEPEYLSVAEQAAIFRGAKAVVGLGGAGLFNTVFCRPGAKVVTIESTTSFIDAHTSLFASAGLDYGVIFGEEDASDPRVLHRRWRLDVKRAAAAIGEFCSSADAAG